LRLPSSPRPVVNRAGAAAPTSLMRTTRRMICAWRSSA
jgi:hypothetical protein